MKIFITLLFCFYNSMVHSGDIVPVPELLFVGNGSGQCTYTSIQEAIDDAPPNSEIRVTIENETYNENLVVNKSLTLKGGYSSCELAQLDSRNEENKSVIDAGFSGTALAVVGNNIVFDLSGFWLQNGLGMGVLPAGGLVVSGGVGSEFNLNHVFVSNNEGILGGGIFINNESLLNLKNTQVFVNQGESGGGIYCDGSSDINLLEGSEINYNIADNGGGIYANNCDVYLKSGTPVGDDFGDSGVSHNVARDSGGGLYLDQSYLIFEQAISNPQLGATQVSENRGNVDDDFIGEGGAIYAINSEMILDFAHFRLNKINDGYGGAIYLHSSTMSTSSNISNCLVYTNKCAWFEKNRTFKVNSEANLRGGVVQAYNSTIGAQNEPLKAYFYGNSADTGSVLSLYSESKAYVQNSYFYDNGNSSFSGNLNNSVIVAHGENSLADISFSTLVDNDNYKALAVYAGAEVSLVNSIVSETSNSNHVAGLFGGQFDASCSVVHESGSFAGIGTEILVEANPGFLNRAQGNLHLAPDSVAIDLCKDSGLAAIDPDRDGDTRGADFIDLNNGNGDFDAGADEYNDVIYKSGFDPAASSII